MALAGVLLVVGLGLGVIALVGGALGGIAGPPFLPLPIVLLGTFAILLAAASEALLFREALKDRREVGAKELLGHSPLAQILLDRQDRVLLLSAGEALRLRRPEGSVTGWPLAALFPARMAPGINAALASSAPSVLEFELPAGNGELRGPTLSLLLGRRDREEGGRVAAILDSTEKARLVAALASQGAEVTRSNRDLERFAYVASHDLQEPLRMVSSYTHLLRERYKGQLDADADDFLGFAAEGAERMQRLIEDLLHYSRVGARRGPPRPVSLDLIVDRGLEDLRGSILESHAQVDRSPLPPALGDETELLQLMENLIGNALKFRGALPAFVRVYSEQKEGEVRYVIEDHGIGIAPADQERIFEPFLRLYSKEEYPGTGIGLAICKKVVEGHGGRIWVESRGVPGEPTRFVFTLAGPGPSAGSLPRRAPSPIGPAEEQQAVALIEERLKELA